MRKHEHSTKTSSPVIIKTNHIITHSVTFLTYTAVLFSLCPPPIHSSSSCLLFPLPPSQVKNLEDENKKLDTKLKILKEQEDYEGDIDNIVKQLKNELEEQIENLLRDQEKLQAELDKNMEEVDDTKKRSAAASL